MSGEHSPMDGNEDESTRESWSMPDFDPLRRESVYSEDDDAKRARLWKLYDLAKAAGDEDAATEISIAITSVNPQWAAERLIIACMETDFWEAESGEDPPPPVSAPHDSAT